MEPLALLRRSAARPGTHPENSMDRATKEATVGELKTKLAKVTSLVVADYTGLTVPAVTGLRDEFRKAQCEYKVYKNTLFKRAIAGTPMEPLAKLFEGTTAVIFSYESPSAPAKVATKYAKDQEKFKLKGAYYEGTVFDAKSIDALATMPGKDELRAKLLATFQAPATNLARTISAAPTNFVYLLAARKEKLGAENQG
jgi:large subunit ribosomal protein L10